MNHDLINQSEEEIWCKISGKLSIKNEKRKFLTIAYVVVVTENK